eukprot:TRINITY_DN1438_c1_g1_i1.p1 TRINITY_DN1438_c1_g1~~TRINITY_DN1438_c1_g1_i1.p1  ORF type:complete len:562 (+),score=70.27 TRINITY_DN1438_c1_g1_i1:334-2019(+)
MAVVKVFESCGKCHALMRRAVAVELERTSDEALLFRGESVASSLVSTYFHEFGHTYWTTLLRRVIIEVNRACVTGDLEVVELDIHKAVPAQKKAVQHSIDFLKHVVSNFFDNMLRGIARMPQALRSVCAMLLEETGRAFPESRYVGVCSFLFLRRICSNLAMPSLMFDLTEDIHPKCQKFLIVASKLIQVVTTGGSKGTRFMDSFTDFVQSKHKQVISIVEAAATCSPSGEAFMNGQPMLFCTDSDGSLGSTGSSISEMGNVPVFRKNSIPNGLTASARTESSSLASTATDERVRRVKSMDASNHFFRSRSLKLLSSLGSPGGRCLSPVGNGGDWTDRLSSPSSPPTLESAPKSESPRTSQSLRTSLSSQSSPPMPPTSESPPPQSSQSLRTSLSSQSLGSSQSLPLPSPQLSPRSSISLSVAPRMPLPCSTTPKSLSPRAYTDVGSRLSRGFSAAIDALYDDAYEDEEVAFPVDVSAKNLNVIKAVLIERHASIRETLMLRSPSAEQSLTEPDYSDICDALRRTMFAINGEERLSRTNKLLSADDDDVDLYYTTDEDDEN